MQRYRITESVGVVSRIAEERWFSDWQQEGAARRVVARQTIPRGLHNVSAGLGAEDSGREVLYNAFSVDGCGGRVPGVGFGGVLRPPPQSQPRAMLSSPFGTDHVAAGEVRQSTAGGRRFCPRPRAYAVGTRQCIAWGRRFCPRPRAYAGGTRQCIAWGRRCCLPPGRRGRGQECRVTWPRERLWASFFRQARWALRDFLTDEAGNGT